MKILALDPFLGGSHKSFLDGIQRYSSHSIIPLTMSDKFMRWRLHGGAVTLAERSVDVTDQIDLLLVSSMTNLPAFIALTNPRFAHVPTLMYMHENQLTLPLPEGKQRDTTFCYINYLSMLAADQLVFSSQFHYDSLMVELPRFLRTFPDHQNLPSVERIAAKSIILHPGLHLNEHKRFDAVRTHLHTPVILWNQRWEYDRNPSLFFKMMDRLDDSGCDFNLILAGDATTEQPREVDKIWKRYGNRILHYGYVDDFERYSTLLHQADIVVSTASYEFFCSAVMEAVYCGCHPLLPSGLTYPELVPQSLREPLLHAPVFYDNEDDLFKKLRKLLNGESRPLPLASLRNINAHLDWSQHILEFDELFDRVVSESKK
ncbi:MAG: Glycosyltransferase [Bacteroidetes bacterium HLUCCA01]|nr:MAG: Glycosyltransferase [Bacteroidetes bacterium HLUCCA01]